MGYTEEERKEAKSKRDKKNYINCREEKLKCVKKYYQNHKKERLEYAKEYQKNHQKEINEYKREYANNRLKTDINFKLINYLRSRLYKAIKNNQKVGSAVKDAGCSVLELKTHLEKQFQLGMSWDNYGKWHIDHIIPLSKFNLGNREEILVACHYTNLQPLWAEENLSKGNK